MTILYVTEMLRWGDEESHHYIIGTYTTEAQAKFAGEVEKTFRGCKYEYRVVPTKLDAPVGDKEWKVHMQGTST